jgi:hypothetical protein
LVALSNFALNSACGWSSNAPLLVCIVISEHNSFSKQQLTTCSYAHLQISFAVLLEEMIRSRLKLLIRSIPKWFQIPYALLGKIIISWGGSKCIGHRIQVLCSLNCKIICCLLSFRYVLAAKAR